MKLKPCLVIRCISCSLTALSIVENNLGRTPLGIIFEAIFPAFLTVAIAAPTGPNTRDPAVAEPCSSPKEEALVLRISSIPEPAILNIALLAPTKVSQIAINPCPSSHS